MRELSKTMDCLGHGSTNDSLKRKPKPRVGRMNDSFCNTSNHGMNVAEYMRAYRGARPCRRWVVIRLCHNPA